MAITGPASYVPTTQAFLSHWESADGVLGAGNELALPDGTVRAGLQSAFDDLVAKRDDLTGLLVDLDLARADIAELKQTLLDRLNQFNEKVRAMHPGSRWQRALSDVPSIGDGQERFVGPMKRSAALWGKLNAAIGTPLTLLGGYAQAAFAADVASLVAAYETAEDAEVDARLAREERNDLQDTVYAMLRSYRQVLPTHFPADHALVDSLPRLTPLPGSTPDAVSASGQYIDTEQYARITWVDSTTPNVSHYELRYSPPPSYDTDSDVVVTTIQPGIQQAITTHGLANPGDTALFKIYVVLNTGNEAGSNTVSITRPV